jgi:hypothetical protein
MIAHDDFRANVFLTIQRLQKAIADGARASEAEDLLLDAIRAAERWYEQLGEVSRCSIGRHVGYCEKDDDLSARLALKNATLLLH